MRLAKENKREKKSWQLNYAKICKMWFNGHSFIKFNLLKWTRSAYSGVKDPVQIVLVYIHIHCFRLNGYIPNQITVLRQENIDSIEWILYCSYRALLTSLYVAFRAVSNCSTHSILDRLCFDISFDVVN